MRTKLLMAVAIGVSLAASAAQAQDKIKIGVLVTLEGVLTTLGEDSLRGLEVALKQAGNKQDYPVHYFLPGGPPGLPRIRL